MSTLSLKRSMSQEYETKSFMMAEITPREDIDDDVEATPMNGPGLSFTRKLFDMLESPESDGIIVWTPGTYLIINNIMVSLPYNFASYLSSQNEWSDGLAFEVKDPKRLELEVLIRYFRHARFQSFVRQLNFYSFKVIYLKGKYPRENVVSLSS
jgi:HSF-type DNA-binding